MGKAFFKNFPVAFWDGFLTKGSEMSDSIRTELSTEQRLAATSVVMSPSTFQYRVVT
jgi:hypothetical protein